MLNTDEVGLVSSSMRFTTGRFSASRSQGKKNPNYLLVKQHLEFRASLLYLSGCTHKIPIVTSYMSKGFPLGTPTPYKITLTQENNLSYQRKHGKNSRNKMTSHLFSLKPPELQESTSTLDSCSSVHPL